METLKYFVVTLILIICISESTQSQVNNTYISDLLVFKTQIVLPIGIEKSGDYFVQINSDYLFVIPTKQRFSNGDYLLYRYNLNNTSIDTFNIPISYNYINGFQISEQYLVISYDKSIHIFQMDNFYSKMEVKSIGKIKIEVYVDHIDMTIDNDLLLICGCELSSSRLSQKTQTSCTKVDLKNAELIDNNYFTNPVGIPMIWFQPRNILAYQKNKILYSDIVDYHLKVFNFDYKLQIDTTLDNEYLQNCYDSLYLNKLNSINIFSTYPRDEMNKIRNLTGDIFLIHKMNYILDDVVLIMKSKPLGSDYNYLPLYDIIRIQDNKIEILKKDLINIKSEDEVYPTKIVLGNFYNTSQNYLIKEEPIPFKINKNINKLDFDKEANEYYKENDIRISLFIYSFNIN